MNASVVIQIIVLCAYAGVQIQAHAIMRHDSSGNESHSTLSKPPLSRMHIIAFLRWSNTAYTWPCVRCVAPAQAHNDMHPRQRWF